MINIALNLGKVALAISAAGIKKEQQLVILSKGIASECYRATGSKVYGPKGHSRDEAFSEQLASEVKSACEKILSQYCDGLKIETSARKEGAPKITIESVLAGLGLEMSDLEKLAADKKAQEVEAPEAEEEVSM